MPAIERFWNLPNTITMVRLVVVPLLLGFPLYAGWRGSLVVGCLYVVAAFGDMVDGWAARRGQQVTRIGKLLDPLADKLIVSTALIVLLNMGRIPAEGWAGVGGLTMVVVVVGRELAVTGLRGLASAGGQVMAARPAGKIKTVSQNIALGFLLFHQDTLERLCRLALPGDWPWPLPDNHEIGVLLLALAAGLALWSGYVYFADYFRAGRAAGGGLARGAGVESGAGHE